MVDLYAFTVEKTRSETRLPPGFTVFVQDLLGFYNMSRHKSS